MKTNIRQIAKDANVSIATVSRVLNNNGYVKKETRDKILQIIQKYGYYPKLSTRNSNYPVIAMVVPDITNPFFSDVIKGVTSVCEGLNLNTIIFNTNENEKTEMRILNMLKEYYILGLIIAPTTDQNEFHSNYLDMMENMGVPVVLFDRDVKYSRLDGVFLDNFSGAFTAVRSLIQIGHKKIAAIIGRELSKTGRDRYNGYCQALKEYNIPFREEYVIHGDFTLKTSYELTEKLLELTDPPTAIFTCNNMSTLGCIQKLYEKQKILGKDISLIGFDEISMLGDVFSVSVIDHPSTEIGTIAANMLLDKINSHKKESQRRIILMPELILRGSEKLS